MLATLPSLPAVAAGAIDAARLGRRRAGPPRRRTFVSLLAILAILDVRDLLLLVGAGLLLRSFVGRVTADRQASVQVGSPGYLGGDAPAPAPPRRAPPTGLKRVLFGSSVGWPARTGRSSPAGLGSPARRAPEALLVELGEVAGQSRGLRRSARAGVAEDGRRRKREAQKNLGRPRPVTVAFVRHPIGQERKD